MSEFEGLGRVGQIALTVGDVAQAVSFYRDGLGMRQLFESGGMAFFDAGGTRLMLGPGGGVTGDGESGRGTVVYFEVGDIGAAHAALESRGVEFLEAPRKVAELESTELWLGFFRDPWGNVLALMSEVEAPLPGGRDGG